MPVLVAGRQTHCDNRCGRSFCGTVASRCCHSTFEDTCRVTSHESKLAYAQTQCFIRKGTYSLSRVAGKAAVEKLCPSVFVKVSAGKNAGIDDA